jgi:hypothetical protein
MRAMLGGWHPVAVAQWQCSWVQPVRKNNQGHLLLLHVI